MPRDLAGLRRLFGKKPKLRKVGSPSFGPKPWIDNAPPIRNSAPCDASAFLPVEKMVMRPEAVLSQSGLGRIY